ncbi:MAG: hypothetical protein HFE63_00140 [Clostridiales bacterium]|nr:hypothetical protein [Clostridiales bacterium]
MYNRNMRIAERFNIKITEYKATKEEITKLVRSSVMANDDSYDVAFCPIDELSSVITDKALFDLNSIDSLNLDKPWWDAKVIEAVTIDDKCYLASSDVTFFPFEATWVLYFNEDFFDKLNIEYPYQDVRDGKWTIDKLNKICTESANLNGQDSFKYNGTSYIADYGITSNEQMVQALMFGSEETLISIENGTPVFDGENERAYKLYENIAEIYGVEGTYLNGSGIPGFRSGHFAFAAETLGHLSSMRDFDGNFGVVPMPKFDEEQENYQSMIASWGTLMTTIPASASDPERTGIILDALAYDSYKNLMEPYYDTYLTNKGVRNDDSADMLKIIRDTRIVNVGRMFGWTNSVINSITSTLKKGDPSVASAIASAKSSVEANIERTLELMNE